MRAGVKVNRRAQVLPLIRLPRGVWPGCPPGPWLNEAVGGDPKLDFYVNRVDTVRFTALTARSPVALVAERQRNGEGLFPHRRPEADRVL